MSKWAYTNLGHGIRELSNAICWTIFVLCNAFFLWNAILSSPGGIILDVIVASCLIVSVFAVFLCKPRS